MLKLRGLFVRLIVKPLSRNEQEYQLSLPRQWNGTAKNTSPIIKRIPKLKFLCETVEVQHIHKTSNPVPRGVLPLGLKNNGNRGTVAPLPPR
jgi:hypothetical protein